MSNVLIISNNTLTFSDSNGRTLLNLIRGIKEKNNLYQFSINNLPGRSNLIKENYSISDFDILQSFKKLRFNVGEINKIIDNKSNFKRKRKKTALKMLIRHYMWSIHFRFNKKLFKWFNSIKPEVIIFQAGDCLQLYSLTIKLCRKFKTKLVVYNSEDYPFKNFDYFSKSERTNPIYSFFKHKLNRFSNKIYKISNLNIFLTDELKKLYEKKLNIKGVCIPNSSSIVPTNNSKYNNPKVIRYFGNLQNNRDQSIEKIAKIIKDNKLPFIIEIFSSTYIKKFENFDFIKQEGFVDYNLLQTLIVSSDVNLHIESFDSFYEKDIKNGFSTKIPDIICSNRLFLLFAPKSIYLSKFISENNLGYYASNDTELLTALREISKSKSNKYSDYMLQYANNYFNIEKNSTTFTMLFEELL